MAQQDQWWEKFKREHIGLATLIQYVSEITVQDASREMRFVHNFCRECYRQLSDKLDTVQKLIDDVGQVPPAEKMLGKIVLALRDTFYSVLTGQRLPVRDSANEPLRHYPLPKYADLEAILESRPTLLEEDVEGLPMFPENVGSVEKYVYELLLGSDKRAQGEDGRRSQVDIRLWRFLLNFHLRIALCTPKPATAAVLKNKVHFLSRKTQLVGLGGYLENQIESFIDDILKKQAKEYVKEGMRKIMTSAVDTAIEVLKTVPAYQPYLLGGGRQHSQPQQPQPQPKTQPQLQSGQTMPGGVKLPPSASGVPGTNNSSLSGNKDGKSAPLEKTIRESSALCADLRAFAIHKWVNHVTNEVDRLCEAAASSIASPIIPQFPTHFRLASVLLPRNESYVAMLLEQNSALKADRATRNNWAGAALIKSRIEAQLKVETRSADQATLWKKWDWLEDDDSRKMLMSLLLPILDDQSREHDMGNLGRVSIMQQSDVDDFNHQLLCQTRSIIVQYSFQTRVLLPKTYDELTMDSFLHSTEGTILEFADFALKEQQKRQKDSKRREATAASHNVSNAATTDTEPTQGHLHTNDSSARQDHLHVSSINSAATSRSPTPDPDGLLAGNSMSRPSTAESTEANPLLALKTSYNFIEPLEQYQESKRQLEEAMKPFDEFMDPLLLMAQEVEKMEGNKLVRALVKSGQKQGKGARAPAPPEKAQTPVQAVDQV